VVVLFAAIVAGAVAFKNDRLSFVVLAVLAAVLLPVSLLHSRRIQRNVAHVAQGPM
jgi:Sec-independent protein secretion pathway component TatC